VNSERQNPQALTVYCLNTKMLMQIIVENRSNIVNRAVIAIGISIANQLVSELFGG